MLVWLQEHVNPDDWEKVEEDIFAPYIPGGPDPDRVDPRVVEEEMSLFSAFTRENRALEGR